MKFAMLCAGADELSVRLAQRQGHFMSPTLIGEQLALYERPGRDEPALEIDAKADPQAIVSLIADWLSSGSTNG